MISVIIPVYNAEMYLQKCLDSIRQQTYKDFEVICVNDGSVDSSESICRSFSELDDRFIVLSQVNSGVSSARNKGLDVAKGDYLCFIDSDDMIHPDFLLTLSLYLSETTLPITSYTRKRDVLGYKSKKTKIYNPGDYIMRMYNEQIEHPMIWSMLFNRHIIEKYKIRFTVGCVRNEDTEFFIKYMVNVDKILTINDKLYYYRVNTSSETHQFKDSAFSYIEANLRIEKILMNKKILGENNFILDSSIQFLLYRSAKSNSNDFYEKIHRKYNVRKSMIRMLRFPRLARKCVAIAYIILGRDLFYCLLSKQFFNS